MKTEPEKDFQLQKTTVLELPPSTENPRNSEGAFLRLADGRLMFVYSRYCGRNGDWGDDAASDLAARYSSDEGASWSRTDRVLISHGDALNVMSVSLLRVAADRIMMLYLRKSRDGNGRVECTPHVTFSTDEGESWEPSRAITRMGGYFVINNDRLLQLKSGRIIAPAAWHRPTETGHDTRALGLIFLSDDHGETFREAEDWILPPQENRNGLQEPGVIETSPDHLLAFFRTDLGCQMFARSVDGGEHWSSAERSDFLSPLSPMTMKHDPFGGSLWAIWNDRSGKWKLPEPLPSSWGRTPLALGVGPNPDALQTMLLECDPACGYCYMALHFDTHSVLLAYCCGGKECSPLQKLKIIRLER